MKNIIKKLGTGLAIFGTIVGTAAFLGHKERKATEPIISIVYQLQKREDFISGTPWDAYEGPALMLQYLIEDKKYNINRSLFREYLSTEGYDVGCLEHELLSMKEKIETGPLDTKSAKATIAECIATGKFWQGKYLSGDYGEYPNLRKLILDYLQR